VTVALLLAVALLLWPASSARLASAVLVREPRPVEHGGIEGPRGASAVRRRLGAHGLPARRVRNEESTLVLLDRLAAGLRAGLTPADALGAAARTSVWASGALDAVLRSVAEGRSGAAALGRAARLRGDEHLGRAARAWALSEGSGAALAEAVDTAARGGRRALDHRRRVGVATAGARASVSLLTLLPIGGIGVGLLLGLTPGELYGTPLAVAALAVGLVLLLVGRLVVTRMVRRVESL
jgi:tight adherence protein B